MSQRIQLDKNGIRINGKYTTLLCASLFYFRIPRDLWKDRIRKLRKIGYNCVDVYFPWNFHEKAPGSWCFEGEADAGEFLDMLAEEKMFVIARPGPYICSEWDGGGIPAWVLASGHPIRENSPYFLEQVKHWYEHIIPIITARDIEHGGTVVLMQLENELDFFDCKDPTSYVGALCKIARGCGSTIPFIGCAGQGGVKRAIGNCEDILPAFNFYPDVNDASFDDTLYSCYRTLESHNLPLIITETAGFHFLLRREFACGARVLGAYNQVAGINFGFTNSINNWGPGDSPLSFIATEYGWRNVINSYGEYTPEALEGSLFSRFLSAFGEKAACAKSLEEHEFQVFAGGKALKRARALRTADGGTFLCVPNFSEFDAKFTIRRGDINIVATVPSHTAPFFGFDLKLDGVAPGFEVLWSTAEIIGVAKNTLTCYGESDAKLHLKLPDGSEADICGLGEFTLSGRGGEKIKVVVLSRVKALTLGFEAEALRASFPRRSYAVKNGLLQKGCVEFRKVGVSRSLHMEDNGIYRGYVQYDATIEKGKGVLISEAGDIVSAYSGGKYIDTRLGNGSFLYYPPAGSENWRFRVESWGHCNFDDPRLPALRMTSKKGVGKIYSVNKVDDCLNWRFKLYDEWLPEKIEIQKSEFDPILTLNSWNSTRTPLIAAYYATFTKDDASDAFVVELRGNRAETALYVDGALAGIFNPKAPFIDITSLCKNNRCELVMLCRKRDWTEPVGNAVVYHAKEAEAEISTLSEDDVAKIAAPCGEKAGLPLGLRPGETAVFDIDTDGVPREYARVKVAARDLKLTAVFNGRVVGRIIGRTKPQFIVKGGEPDRFYIPHTWYKPRGNRLSLYLEAIGEDPELESVSFIETLI